MARPLPALSPLCVAGSKAWAAERPITGLIFAKDGALIAEHSVGATRFGPLGEACEARDDDPTPPAFAREVKRGARRAVVDRSDDTIAVFHKDTQVQTLPASQRGARRALAWPPRGDVLAVATVPGFVEVWDIPTGTLRWSRFAGAGVHTLIWARDGDSLLVAVEALRRRFDAATGARLAPTQHVSPPRYLIPSRDGSALLSSSGGISFTEVDPHTMRWPLDDLGNPTFIEAVHVCDTDAGLLTCADVVTLHADAAHTIFAPTPPPDDFFWRGVSCLAAPTQAPLDFVCAIDRGGAGRVVRLDPAGVAPEVVLYHHRHRAPRLIALSLAAQRLAIGVTGRDVLLCDPVTGDITHTLRGLVRFPDGFAWRERGHVRRIWPRSAPRRLAPR